MDQIQQTGKSVFLFYFKKFTQLPHLHPSTAFDGSIHSLYWVRADQGWCWAEGTSQPPADALGPTPLPLPGQGGCSGEVGRNVGGWRAPGGRPGSTSALVALRSQEAGQGGV